MSIHPNVLLIRALIPDDLPSKTYREILALCGLTDDDPEVKIGDSDYSVRLMDGDYYESMQVRAPSGSIVFFETVTYGYGDVIAWDKLVAEKEALHAKLTEIAAQTKCRVEITVSANYW